MEEIEWMRFYVHVVRNCRLPAELEEQAGGFHSIIA